MHRAVITAVVGAVALALAAPVLAQLSNRDAPAIVGHFHLNVTSVDAHKKFWVDTLGGTAGTYGGEDIVRFPDTLIFLHVRPPTGPTRGLTSKVVANGYQLTTGREPMPGQEAAAPSGTAAPYGRFSYLLGPDGVKVELVTSEDKNGPPIRYHHVHFINKQYVEMQQWYMKAFGASLRPGQTDFFIGADLPGVGYSLNFFRWEGDQNVTHVPTAGRVVDHVGFEVKDLAEWCRTLEDKGLKLTVPYTRVPVMNMAHAFITDPWGVSIELTEGLRP